MRIAVWLGLSRCAWGQLRLGGEFLTALAGEATDGLQLLMDPERAWFAARRAVAGRRRHSRAAMAVDILAAAPLVCASSLAAGLGMAVNNAAVLLEGFCAAGFAVELTHRAKRRLFGLAALTPVREVAPPRRPAAIPLADPVTERAAAARASPHAGGTAALRLQRARAPDGPREQTIRHATATLDVLARGAMSPARLPSGRTSGSDRASSSAVQSQSDR